MSEKKQDNRFMEFRLDDHLYAIPLLSVKEVIQKPEVTSMPNMPAFFEGIINLRGQILGVFSARKKIGAKLKSDSQSNNEVVVVIERDGVHIGMVVDEVTRVLHPPPEMIRPAPLKEDHPARAFITSVIQSGEDLVLTMDVVKLLELEKYIEKSAA